MTNEGFEKLFEGLGTWLGSFKELSFSKCGSLHHTLLSKLIFNFLEVDLGYTIEFAF
jgi:hypothetical protein